MQMDCNPSLLNLLFTQNSDHTPKEDTGTNTSNWNRFLLRILHDAKFLKSLYCRHSFDYGITHYVLFITFFKGFRQYLFFY